MTEPKPSSQYHTHLDHLVSKAATYKGKERWNRYVLCRISARVVGQYVQGATEQLARNIGVTVSRVQDYAAAGQCYLFLRQHGLDLPTMLGVSSDHMTDAYKWLRKVEMKPSDLVEDIRTASNENINREQFAKLMRDHYGDKPPAEWSRRLARIEGSLADLSVDTDVPESARVVLDDLVRIAKRARVEEPTWKKLAWAVLEHIRSIIKDPEAAGGMLAWAHAQAAALPTLFDEWGI